MNGGEVALLWVKSNTEDNGDFYISISDLEAMGFYGYTFHTAICTCRHCDWPHVVNARIIEDSGSRVHICSFDMKEMKKEGSIWFSCQFVIYRSYQFMKKHVLARAYPWPKINRKRG